MEDFVAPLIEGGGSMNDASFLETAMTAVTTVFTFITGKTDLAAIALGFPVAIGATRVIKRICKF